MSTELPDTNGSSPAPEPLALKSNDGLGAVSEARRLTLTDVTKGDAVALYRRSVATLDSRPLHGNPHRG